MGGNDIAAGSTGSTRNTQNRSAETEDRYGREQTAREQFSNYSDHAATNGKNRAMSSRTMY